MTTYDEGLGLDTEGDVDAESPGESAAERRSPTSTVRVSWASPRPFVTPRSLLPHQQTPAHADTANADTDTDTDTDTGTDFDPVERAGQRRTVWASPLVRRTLVGDALAAMAVWGIAIASFGVDLPVALLGAVVAAVVWCLILWVVRAYDSRRIGQGPEEFGMVGRAAVVVTVLVALTAYSLELLVPRRYVLVAVPLATVLTALHRYVVRRWLHRQRAQGVALMRTLVVGSPSAVDDVVRDLSVVPYHGYDVVGACVPSVMSDVGLAAGVTVVGTLSDIPQAVIEQEADVVIVAGSGLSNSSLRRLSWALERTGADLVVAPGLVEVAGPRLRVRPAAGLSLLHVEAPEQHQGRLLGKALLDRTLGLAMFVVALPVVAVSALLVRTTSRGPAFFTQERMGRDGRPFRMFKLRSMVTDAEAKRTGLLDESDRDGLMFKMHADPRITRVGRQLRRFSIDELPQLWNVVRGDMSLVGPRPPLREEYEKYHDSVHRRLRVKPGLTGLWQVSGRADLTWEESVRLDLRYVDNWSVAFDLQILWKTARAVLFGSGAY